MQKRKVWKILTSLGSTEQDYFLRWLWAEWAERQEYVQRLAKYLVSCSPNAPSMQDAWGYLYPSDSYDDRRLRKLLRDLTKQLEIFIALQAVKQDEDLINLYQLIGLDQRNLPELLQKQVRKTEREQASQQPKDASHFRMQYQTYALLLRHESKHKQYETYVQRHAKMMRAFDAWWMLERLNLKLAQTFDYHVAPLEQMLLHDERVMDLVANRNENYSPANLDLLEELLLVLDPNSALAESQRQAFIMGLEKKIIQWPDQPANNLVRSTLNYFLREISRRQNESQKRSAAKIFFELFSLAFHKEYLLVNGFLSWHTLRTVVNVALSIPDYAKAEELLKQLLDFLPEEEREEAFVINQANILFAQKKYSEIIGLLATRNFSKPLYEVQARHTLMVCYYELQPQEEDWLLSQIDKNIRFIQAQPVSQTIITGNLNLLKLMRRLIKVEKKQQLLTLQAEVDATQPLSRGQWLKGCIAKRLESEHLT